MAFNNLIIEKSGFFSFLICKKEMIKFYKKNHWVNISSKNVNVKDHPFNHYSMIYNCIKLCYFLVIIDINNLIIRKLLNK